MSKENRVAQFGMTSVKLDNEVKAEEVTKKEVAAENDDKKGGNEA